MSIRPEIRSLDPYHFKARPYTTKLDQNESPFDLPDALKTRVAERIRDIDVNRYPEIDAHSLRQALSRHLGWPEEGLVISNGSNVLIQALVIAAGLGRRVLSVSPTFSVYSLQASVLGVPLTEIPLEADFSLPTEALKAELANGEGIFFLAAPAAPTGNLFSDADILDLVEAAQPNWTVVIDEAYHQFSGSDFSNLAQQYPHVVCLRTFSKAFGLGGARLGYALTHPDVAEQIQKVLLPFSVSALQVAVGVTVLDAPEYTERYINLVKGERERIAAELSRLDGIKVFPSLTNFLLFRVEDAAAFYEGLLERGVLIRRQDHLPGLSGCLRVSVGTEAENSAFLEAARAVHQDLKSQTETAGLR